ncbi:MAG: hypothetical protein PVF54_10400 [Anaerolineae bacterium]
MDRGTTGGSSAAVLPAHHRPGTENDMLRLRRKRSAFVFDGPTLMLAHAGDNSLPASREALAGI